MVKHKAKLEKSLTLFELTMYGIGIILGAGIYAIIGKGAGIAGHSLWLSFIIAAIIASFTGFSYMELSSRYPKDAAEYVYAKKAFNQRTLPFLIIWVMMIAGIISAATVASGFGGYFKALFGVDVLFSAIGLIALMSLINFIGIKESAKMNIFSTIVETFGLLIIIALGIFYINPAVINYFSMPNGLPGVLSATALIFFAFIGFEGVANISEEVKNARKIVPKALMISLTISTILYILVTVSAVSIMAPSELAASEAPLSDIASAAAGADMHLLMSVIALFATGNTVLILLMVGSRVLYGVAKDGALPRILAKVHKKRLTPHYAIITVMILSMLTLFIGDIEIIALLTDIGIFITYFFVNLSLIIVRYKYPRKKGVRSPVNIGKFPVLAGLGCLTTAGMLFYFDPIVVVAEVFVILVGLGVYHIVKR